MSRHLRECSAIRSSQSLSGWCAFAVVLLGSGCSSPTGTPSPAVGSAPAPAAVEKPKVVIAQPSPPEAGDLGLVENGQIVRVGERLEDAEAILKPAKDVYQFREESPVDNQAIEATGWESGKHKVGVLVIRGRLVLAISTIDNASESLVNEIIAEHERNFGPPNTQHFGVASRYRFWAKGNARLMICDSLDAQERLSVTAVIGQYDLMDAISMSSRQAEQDLKEADEMLERLRKRRAAK